MRRDIAERLRAGERFLLDGATGSELQRRKVDLSHGITEGGDLGAWSATAMGEAPDQVRAVHEDCFGVGADIVTTNSFWTNRVRLGLAGLAHKAEEYTRLAAELARSASVSHAGATSPARSPEVPFSHLLRKECVRRTQLATR